MNLLEPRRLARTPAIQWDDVHDRYEYATTQPLTGWRVSLAGIDGTIYPFDTGPHAYAICALKPAHCHQRADRLHVTCQCGIHLVDTPQHLAAGWGPILAAMRERTRDPSDTDQWAGIVACRIDTAGHVARAATPRTMLYRTLDPPGSFRTSAALLRHVYVPTGTTPGLTATVRDRYTGVPVTDLHGPLRTITSIKPLQTP